MTIANTPEELVEKTTTAEEKPTSCFTPDQPESKYHSRLYGSFTYPIVIDWRRISAIGEQQQHGGKSQVFLACDGTGFTIQLRGPDDLAMLTDKWILANAPE